MNEAGTFGSLIGLAADDRLVRSRSAKDVVRFDREHFLQGMPCAIAFERPDFHFTETLAAELRLAAEGLLRDQRVWTDGTHVRLVFHEVV